MRVNVHAASLRTQSSAPKLTHGFLFICALKWLRMTLFQDLGRVQMLQIKTFNLLCGINNLSRIPPVLQVVYMFAMECFINFLYVMQCYHSRLTRFLLDAYADYDLARVMPLLSQIKLTARYDGEVFCLLKPNILSVLIAKKSTKACNQSITALTALVHLAATARTCDRYLAARPYT